MLAPTLPNLSNLDREALHALLLAEHHERLATHQQLLRREIEIEPAAEPATADAVRERQIELLELRPNDLQQAQAAYMRHETWFF